MTVLRIGEPIAEDATKTIMVHINADERQEARRGNDAVGVWPTLSYVECVDDEGELGVFRRVSP